MAQTPPDTTDTSGGYWEKARARLSAKEQNYVDEILDIAPVQAMEGNNQDGGAEAAEQGGSTWPDRLLSACQDAKAQYKIKQLSITVAGKEVVLHEIWDTAIEMLDKVKDVGDVATSGNDAAGLGWSIARIFIQIAVKQSEVAKAVAEGISTALIVMSRGIVYEHQLKGPWRLHFKENLITFQGFIVDLYEATLRFLTIASRHYTKSSFRRTWFAMWNPSTITEFCKKAKEIQDDIRKESGTSFMIGVEGALMDVMQLQGNLEKGLETLEKSSLTELQLLYSQDKRQLAAIRAAALSWFSNFKHMEHHKSARKGRVEGTANWILTHWKYIHWILGASQILWIHGIPGAGKTKLISRLVDEFLTPGRSSQEESVREDRKVAFFYCNKYDTDRGAYIQILCSLLRQLAEYSPSLPNKIQDEYEKCHRNYTSAATALEAQECQDLLKEVFRYHKEVILLVDALDECSESSRANLLDAFDELIIYAKEKEVKMKIVISSREDPDITHRLQNNGAIAISALDNGDDIMKMVNHKINSFRVSTKDATRESPIITEDLEKDIIALFERKAGAMFQWAVVHIDFLLSRPTANTIKGALQKTPQGLTEAYDEVFSSIKNDIDWGRIAMNAFSWLHVNGGSCSSTTLTAAAGFRNEKSTDNDDATLEVHDILKACQNLVTLEPDQTVRFSHLSVQEHFHSSLPEAEQVHQFAAIVCLKTLLYIDPREDGQSRKLKALWRYAYGNWWIHIQGCQDVVDVNTLWDELVSTETPSRGFSLWLLHLKIDIVNRCKRPVGSRPRSSVIFSWAVWPKFAHICSSSLDWTEPDDSAVALSDWTEPNHSAVEWSDWTESNFMCGDLILQAVVFKSVDITRDLMASEPRGLHLLRMSIKYEQLPPPRPNDSSSSGVGVARIPTCPLTNDSARSLEELESTVHDLLGFVAGNHHKHIVRLYNFIRYSTNKPQKLRKELRILILILFYKYGSRGKTENDLFHYVLEQHTQNALEDFRSQQYEYLHPPDYSDFSLSLGLVTNSIAFELQKIKSLIECGADVNLCVEYEGNALTYGTPLIAAVAKDDSPDAEGVKVLIRHGANINKVAKIGSYGTALIAASQTGKITSLDALLEQPNANLNAVASTGEFPTALIAACAKGNFEVARKLLQHGAKANLATDNINYPSAMAVALRKGQFGFALLCLGLDVSSTNQNLGGSLPDSLDAAISRWPFFSQRVWVPIVTNAAADSTEWQEQCGIASQRLLVALLYYVLSKSSSWMQELLPSALECLRIFSSNGSHDFRAAKVVASQLGFSELDVGLHKSFRKALRNSNKVKEEETLGMLWGIAKLAWKEASSGAGPRRTSSWDTDTSFEDFDMNLSEQEEEYEEEDEDEEREDEKQEYGDKEVETSA